MDAPRTPSPLGRSLLLKDGDLPLAEGDFQPVEGRENFLQGLRAAIATPFASDVFNNRYGFDLLACLATPQPPALVKELIRLNIVRSLTRDDRVRQIKEIAFDDELRYFELDAQSDFEERRLARQRTRQWQALVVLETVTSETAVLSLSGLGA